MHKGLVIGSALFCAFHSFLASRTAKRKAKSIFGLKLFRKYYRLFFTAASIAALLPLAKIYYPLIQGKEAPLYSLDRNWRWLSHIVFGINIASTLGSWLTFFTTFDVLHFCGFSQITHEEEDETKAPFAVNFLGKWVRHPIYSFSLLMLWAQHRMSPTQLAVTAIFTAHILIGVRFEEQRLVEEIGEEYVDYMKKTPRFCPFFNLH